MRALGRGGAVLAAAPKIRVAAVRCTSGGRLAGRVGVGGLASPTSTLFVEAQPRSVRPQAATHRTTAHSNRGLSACVRRDGSTPNCILLGDRCPVRMSSWPGGRVRTTLSGSRGTAPSCAGLHETTSQRRRQPSESRINAKRRRLRRRYSPSSTGSSSCIWNRGPRRIRARRRRCPSHRQRNCRPAAHIPQGRLRDGRARAVARRHAHRAPVARTSR